MRKLLISFLVLTVLARTAHCLCLDASLFALETRHNSPLSDPIEGDPDESSCLCKGVVFAPACDVADPRVEVGIDWSLLASRCPVARIFAVERQPAIDLVWPPPVSAGQMRALLAVWQI